MENRLLDDSFVSVETPDVSTDTLLQVAKELSTNRPLKLTRKQMKQLEPQTWALLKAVAQMGSIRMERTGLANLIAQFRDTPDQ